MSRWKKIWRQASHKVTGVIRPENEESHPWNDDDDNFSNHNIFKLVLNFYKFIFNETYRTYMESKFNSFMAESYYWCNSILPITQFDLNDEFMSLWLAAQDVYKRQLNHRSSKMWYTRGTVYRRGIS